MPSHNQFQTLMEVIPTKLLYKPTKSPPIKSVFETKCTSSKKEQENIQGWVSRIDVQEKNSGQSLSTAMPAMWPKSLMHKVSNGDKKTWHKQ